MLRLRFLLSLILIVIAATSSAVEGQLRVAHLNPPTRRIIGQVYRDLHVTVNSTRLASAGGASQIQVRLLRGSRAQLRNSPRTRDGCVILRSVLLNPVHTGAGTLDLNFVFSDEWVRISRGRPQPEIYTLVFEYRNNVGNTLKLRAANLAAYLANSVEVVLQPPQNLSQDRIRDIAIYSQPQPIRLTQAGQCWTFSANLWESTRFAMDGRCGSFTNRETVATARINVTQDVVCLPSTTLLRTVEIENDEVQGLCRMMI